MVSDNKRNYPSQQLSAFNHRSQASSAKDRNLHLNLSTKNGGGNTAEKYNDSRLGTRAKEANLSYIDDNDSVLNI